MISAMKKQMRAEQWKLGELEGVGEEIGSIKLVITEQVEYMTRLEEGEEVAKKFLEKELSRQKEEFRTEALGQ